ncbi:anti-sigma-I factor RsgI family protein [Alkalihalobacterium elongatum]|uniref:anti-sigma-I factor RsgI family protein n=1 Tax=Alkalihalobacterium elongatum TaxID=2675466 RepID=UPI001C1FE126|nr:hypothetical protein [Alkalihalobacterium elongatum]
METIKGTVVKVTEQQIVLLTTDGKFKNIPRSPSEVPLIGQSFTHIEKPKRTIPIFKLASVAAALFLIIVTSFIFPLSGKGEEVYIISLDINPSFELGTDRHLQVTRAEGLNEQGLEIVQTLDWNENLYVVIDEIIDLTIEAGYIEKQVEPLVVTSVIPLQEASDQLIDDLKDAIDTSLGKNHATVPVTISLDEKEVYDEAKQSNLPVNYYKQYKQLEKRGIVKNKEEIKGKTISELKRMENQPKNERAKERSQSSKSYEQKKENDKQNKGNSDNKKPAKEQKQQDNSNRGKAPENKGQAPEKAPSNAGKSSENKGNAPSNKGNSSSNSDSNGNGKSPANNGAERQEIKGPATPSGQQNQQERPGASKSNQAPQNNNGNRP